MSNRSIGCIDACCGFEAGIKAIARAGTEGGSVNGFDEVSKQDDRIKSFNARGVEVFFQVDRKVARADSYWQPVIDLSKS